MQPEAVFPFVRIIYPAYKMPYRNTDNVDGFCAVSRTFKSNVTTSAHLCRLFVIFQIWLWIERSATEIVTGNGRREWYFSELYDIVITCQSESTSFGFITLYLYLPLTTLRLTYVDQLSTNWLSLKFYKKRFAFIITR